MSINVKWVAAKKCKMLIINTITGGGNDIVNNFKIHLFVWKILFNFAPAY